MKNCSNSHLLGMIASHLGIVRGNSLNGSEVSGVEVRFDKKVIADIVNNAKQIPGIYEVYVETYDGKLNVGEEIMAVVIGGDTREHVFPALIDTVDQIKARGSFKKEIFKPEVKK